MHVVVNDRENFLYSLIDSKDKPIHILMKYTKVNIYSNVTYHPHLPDCYKYIANIHGPQIELLLVYSTLWTSDRFILLCFHDSTVLVS